HSAARRRGDRMTAKMRRREFITLLGGTAAWPLVARAQQPAMPVIGFLYAGSFQPIEAYGAAAFRKGLSEMDYVEGRNVVIEYRSAQNENKGLSELATDLVRRRVAVIATPGSPDAAVAAKFAATTIPIVFGTGSDPVKEGLVTTLNRPGGNITGVSTRMVPATWRFALLVEPSNPTITEPTVRDVEAAARSMGFEMRILHANTSREIDAAFAAFAQDRPDALFVGPSAFFNARRVQLAQWAATIGSPPPIPIVKMSKPAG